MKKRRTHIINIVGGGLRGAVMPSDVNASTTSRVRATDFVHRTRTTSDTFLHGSSMPGKTSKSGSQMGRSTQEESYWEDKIEPMSKLGIDSPGPLKYPDIDSNFKKLSKYKSYGSVRIAEGNPKSDVDWKIYRASFIPSSADYNPNASLKGPSGGQFSTAFAKTALEWEIYRAKQLPGPQDYYPKESLKDHSFRFSEARPKSDVEWMMYRAETLRPCRV